MSVGVFAGATSFIPLNMLRTLDTYPEFRETLRGVEAGFGDADGASLRDLVLGGDGPKYLRDHPDPALPSLVQIATALGAYAVGQRAGTGPAVLLGHSFGEITALVAAGAFLPADGARIVRTRMRLAKQVMDLGGMTALDIGAARATSLLETVASASLRVACHNTPRSTVVSGTLDDLQLVDRLAGLLGIRAVRLPVRFAYHSPVMASLVDTLRQELAASGIHQRPLRTPVHCVFHNRRHTDQDDLLGHIAEMYVRPVLFAESLRTLHSEGIDRYLDYGGDGTITRMVEATLPAVQVTSPIPGPASAAAPEPSTVPAAAEPEDIAIPYRQAPAVENAERSARPAVAESVPSLVREDLLAELATMYAEVVGYPADVFTEDVDLEADLGIDSLRQVAVLTKVTERFGLARTEIKLSDYPTLGSVADSVTAQLAGGSR
ncbi:acyltransferase domain-containing protein [Amycolatopsis sp. NPDC059021]|uniref:acyltransferase domain-containing protein n=1 Tax=Amycolatopsis sp. NPDC059021 TaxID=3346704 RepID=UPI00366F29E9